MKQWYIHEKAWNESGKFMQEKRFKESGSQLDTGSPKDIIARFREATEEGPVGL